MLVVSSPSGAGKTTITRLLRETDKNLKLSISVTTRPRRPSEIEGTHYYFVSKDQFKILVDQGELLEWAEVHGNYYGTPTEPVMTALSRGEDVLFDIDWQGTQQLYQKARSLVVSIFIIPPSLVDLHKRLHMRAEDSISVIAQRMANSIKEMLHWVEYDYVLENNDLQECLRQVQTILDAERLKRVLEFNSLNPSEDQKRLLKNGRALERDANPNLQQKIEKMLASES